MKLTECQASTDYTKYWLSPYTNSQYPDFKTPYLKIKEDSAKDVKVNDIIYWVERSPSAAIERKVSVQCGIIVDVYPDCYVANHLAVAEYITFRLYDEKTEKLFTDTASWREYFQNVSWRKYPSKKELSDSRHLFTFNRKPLYELIGGKPPNLKDIDAIKAAYKSGIICKRNDVVGYASCPYSEIDKGSWKPILKSDYESDNTTLSKSLTFATYDDAVRLKDCIEHEYDWVSGLTDEQYTLLEMDKALNKLVRDGMLESDARRIAYFMLKQKKLVDIEFRTLHGKFQWRSYDNKKWNNVNPENIPLIEDEV